MEVKTKTLLLEFMQQTHKARKRKNVLVSFVLTILAIIAVTPLLLILGFLISKGVGSLSWEFLTSLPKGYGETGGGMGNAIVGSFVLISLASIVGIPLGLGTGVFLSEARSESRFASIVRSCTELMAGIPSIVVGLFAYFVAVLPFGGFSAFAGGLSLSIIMVPVIARTSEEVLRLVPVHVREAGLALGIPAWKVLLRIVLRGSRKGLITAVLLAVARASGETAPLLFTALNNRLWNVNPSQPISSLPVQIYTYATSPSAEWHQQAWAAALLLVLLVLGFSLSARLLLSGKKHG